MRPRPPFVLVALACLGLAVFTTPRAQAPAKAFRVGVLCPITCASSGVRTFVQALADLGYKEGANIAFEYEASEGDLKRLPGLAGELAEQKVDVIYTTWGTAAGLAAKRTTAAVPIVVGSAGDLVAAGIVKSLSHPGSNVTGITSLALELEGKRLEFLRELLPDVARVAVFHDPANPYSVLAMKRQRRAAGKLGIELIEIQVHQTADVDPAFARIAEQRLKALCIHAYVPVLASRERIVELAAARHVSAVYPLRDYVDAGGLMSYGASLNENAKRAASQVAKILGGVKPADIPVEQSTKVEFVINLKTAQALGISVPPALLARADEVIE